MLTLETYVSKNIANQALIATIVYKRQKSPLICTGVVDLDEV